MKVKCNINDKIRFKLTERGERVLLGCLNKLSPITIPRDEEGYIELSFWEFLSIFNDISWAVKEIFEDNTFFIEGLDVHNEA